MRSSHLMISALVLAPLAGCGFFRRLAGNDTISLEKAQVKSMSVDLRRQEKTICPRQPVQMAVFADVVLEGEEKAKKVETWQGRDGANKNDKLDFAEFAFHSEQGSFNKSGWFSPNPNLLLTAGKEFEIKSVYRRRPDKFTFTTSYKPDYTCIHASGASGAAGVAGNSGQSGSKGTQGSSGSSSSAGGDGGDGSAGTSGGDGGNGGPGPHLLVYATMVKTPFYEKLVGIRIEGDDQDFLLVPAGQKVSVRARGGSGGSGGAGGRGGAGGSGGSGNPGGRGGRGGPGAQGGNGGNGGPGGTIELVYDARFPELSRQIHLDVSGGSAGPGGHGGAGGSAGRGGSGMTPPSSSGQSPPRAQKGPEGSAGSGGSDGTAGHRGSPGEARSRAGDVADKFAGAGEITAL